MQKIDMNQIVGSHHILFLCLDSLRYDVAYEEQQSGGTPVLNQYGAWRKCQAPGNFTYPSHQAMFAGFFPVDEGVRDMAEREKLFFSEDLGMGRKAPDGAFSFQGANWIEGLQKEGYETYCIGGVSFFDKRTDLGKVMPSYFQHSYWNPSFGCMVKESARHQIDFAVRKLGQIRNGNEIGSIQETGYIPKEGQNQKDKKIAMYLNLSALHYPTYFYLEDCDHNGRDGWDQKERKERQWNRKDMHEKDMGSKDSNRNGRNRKDSKESQRAALRYVDGQLGRLLEAFRSLGDTFVICCSDHGTCYGEDGVWYHGINHPIVNTVPYKHFILYS